MTKFGRRALFTYSLAAWGSSFALKGCAPDFSALDRPLSQSLDGGGEGEQNAAAAAGIASAPEADTQTDIAVGLLHSLSGPLAITEAPLVDAERLAIEEINAAGGLLGKQLVPVIEDGASDWPTFAEKTEKMIAQQAVAVIFGGFTSASRKAILPVVTAKNRLLWYPGAHEGEECSQHIFYGGAIANKKPEPPIKWVLGEKGKSFFLVSTNERTTHNVAKDLIKQKGGKVAGEAFVPLSNSAQSDMGPVIDDIRKALPEGGIIVNALVGEQNLDFFKAMRGAGLSADRYIVLAVRLSEPEIAKIGEQFLVGHYAAWPYFQTLETPTNEPWVKAFQQRYGADQVVGGPAQTAYAMVKLWAQAVTQAQTTKTTEVRMAAYGQMVETPGGPMTVQPNHHVEQPMYLGQVRPDGLFDIAWEAPGAIAPTPWNQRIAVNKGVICDWSDPDKGQRYQPEPEPTVAEPAP